MAQIIASVPDTDDDAAHTAADLAVLAPDRTLTLGGRTVTLREYGFFEGLDVADRAADFLADLIAASDDGTLRYAHVRRLYGRHRAIVPVIAAQAGDVEVLWLEALASDEIEFYLATWFAVNAGFFVREAWATLREQALAAAHVSPGAPSSPASPPPDSAISLRSVAVPNAN